MEIRHSRGGRATGRIPAAAGDGGWGDLNVGYWLVVDGKAVQLFKFKKENFDYYAFVLDEYRERLGPVAPFHIPPCKTIQVLRLRLKE
mgnify:CR=1 FL=1